MILHLVNRSPANHAAFDDCLRAAQAGATVLLLEDGVYAATDVGAARIAQHAHLQFCALQPDILARGLQQLLHPAVKPISDEEFVALCVSHHSVVSWS